VSHISGATGQAGLNMAVQEDAVLAQKIAEMQKQFKAANISAARERRYGVTLDDGPRIVINQCSCDIQTKHFGYRGVGCRQNWNPILVVMRIARQDVHGAMLEQPLRAAAGCLSPESSHGGGGYLHKTAFLGPFQNPPEILLQDRISLRVSQHGSKAEGKQARAGSITFSLGCDFHLSYDNLEAVLSHPERYTICQVLGNGVGNVSLIGIMLVGVRRGYNVIDGILAGEPTTNDQARGTRASYGTIVDLWKNVAVDIDHGPF
jgi:hypothetical protein